MRILVSLTYYYPNISGLTLYVQNLAELLATHNSVTILTAQYTKRLALEETKETILIKRVPVFWKIGKGIIMPIFIFCALDQIHKNDVIIINLPQFEGFILAILGKIMRKKVICIYHCDVRLPTGFINSVAQSILYVANYLSLYFCDRIVTYTQDYAVHTQILRIFAGKLSVTYPLIRQPMQNLLLRNALRKKIPQAKRFHIGMAARISAEKGFEYLLQSIPILKDTLGDNFIILVAGPKNPIGEENYLNEILPLLSQYQDYIFFFDTIDYKELGSFYELLDVLVVASINSTESFGMVQVEAMLSGVPVVATNLPGVRVPIKLTGMGLLVEPRNASQLADAICKVISNKRSFRKQKKTIQNYFSWETTRKFYETLITKE